MRISTLLVGIVLLVSAVSTSAQSTVAGNWALSFNTPNGTRESAAVFKVDGDTLTGTLTSEMGEMPLKGKAKGNTFAITLDVQTQNGTLSINITGEVDGDTLKGTLDFGQGTGEFTGKRKAS
jgi:hypothetical protein